ncbi:MAG TPA: glucoamylase family protein [Tepidisphaeraceae bacterium]|nr:glucoamylase family protein [Tepidisphaeraceae bacterium]
MIAANVSRDVLEELQKQTFDYFLYETNPDNGLVIDKTQPGTPASIAAVGLALSSYPVGVERGLISRADAVRRVVTTLRFFQSSTQSTARDATGYKGFYYHFLDMKTGKRAWKCELSTIDTALLLAGVLTAGQYFLKNTSGEREIRKIADDLYLRVDWNWARNGSIAITHGWKPERGFLPYHWTGYNEALILYLLALGSPTFPLPRKSYKKWTSTYEWKRVYGHEFLYSGPLFTHQLSHLWVDFRGIQDAYMRKKSIDYFENSRRATYVQRQYAIDNPNQFKRYGANCWGITASDGPGPARRTINGRKRKFFGYLARGVPDGPDDGSLAPWAVVASLPFAPEIVLPAMECFESIKLREKNPYGFKATFNATFPQKSSSKKLWVSPYHYGLNQGPIILMIENFITGLVWRVMRECPYLVTGLGRAGFSGGWLGDKSTDN